jgi:hypothetical protein
MIAKAKVLVMGATIQVGGALKRVNDRHPDLTPKMRFCPGTVGAWSRTGFALGLCVYRAKVPLPLWQTRLESPATGRSSKFGNQL